MSDVLTTLRAWRRQRFPHPLFVPVALTLVVASLVGEPWPSAAMLGVRVVAAWLAVLALRLWDDLEDRQRDAVGHPERVLTAVSNARPYAWFVAISLAVAASMAVLGGGTAWSWFALVGALLLVYRVELHTGSDFVVLLKYPLLVLALGGTSVAALALTLAAVSMDELLQRPSPSRRGVVAGTVALVGAACLMLIQTPEAPVVALAVQTAMVAAIAALCFQTLWGKPRRKLTRGGLLAMTFGTLLLCHSSRLAELLHAH